MKNREPEWMHGGYILRANRERIGFTQDQVALMMDINPRTYQRWESCETEPSFGLVMSICECVFKTELTDAIVVAQEAADECKRAG